MFYYQLGHMKDELLLLNLGSIQFIIETYSYKSASKAFYKIVLLVDHFLP